MFIYIAQKEAIFHRQHSLDKWWHRIYLLAVKGLFNRREHLFKKLIGFMTSGQMQQFNPKLWPKVEIYWRISKSHVHIKEFEELKRVQIKYFDAPVWVKYFCKPLCIFATGNDALFYILQSWQGNPFSRNSKIFNWGHQLHIRNVFWIDSQKAGISLEVLFCKNKIEVESRYQNSLDAEIQDKSTSISIVVKFE